MKELEIRNLPELPFNVTEALNQLRINLSFCGSQVKTVMVTSSVPNEGKSFIAMQLWKMMAEVGGSIVLIDCDFRNSEMRYKYNIASVDAENLIGAPYYLAGWAEMQDVIYKTNIPNGYMVPVTSSIANPTILLESQGFAELLDYCRQNFDYILVDTPPLGSVADALNIARYCDGSVLVVRSGDTPRKLVENSVQMLKRAESPLLGIVLNRVDLNSRSSIIAVDTIMKMGTDMADLGMAVGPHMKSCRPAEENKMKSKRMVRIAGLALVSLVTAAMGMQAFAAQWHPSRTQQEVEVVQNQVTASDGAVITIHTAPAVEQGTVPKAEEVLQVESATQALIQITPVSSALAANAAVMATNPQATSEQLADVATGSGLTFAANGQLSALYQQVREAQSTQQLMDSIAPEAAASFESTVGAGTAQYTPIAMYDVTMSPAALTVLSQQPSMEVAIMVPGVEEGTQLAAVCWNRSGQSQLVPVRVKNGVVYLSVRTSGPVMLLVRVQGA